MGITVGAALKKAAIAILGNPKTLKKLLFAVLVVCVALLLPMVMVVCLFSGSFQVDSGELLRYVEANLTASDVELLQNVETTMMEIENAMIEAELSADVGAAQALYIMALYDFASLDSCPGWLPVLRRNRQTPSSLPMSTRHLAQKSRLRSLLT